VFCGVKDMCHKNEREKCKSGNKCGNIKRKHKRLIKRSLKELIRSSTCVEKNTFKVVLLFEPNSVTQHTLYSGLFGGFMSKILLHYCCDVSG